MDASANGRRIRALVIAEQCNPEWTSVPLEGWSHARALAGVADVHIATSAWNRPALERAGLTHGVDFTAFDTEALSRPIEKLVNKISGANKGWSLRTALSIPSYLMFERTLWRHFRADIDAGQFDLVHRLTPISPAIPSVIAGPCRRAGLPFVIGPMNGGLAWPAEFPGLRSRESDWIAYAREAYRLFPYYRATRNRASAIVIGSASAMRDLPQRWHGRAIYVPENGFEPERFPLPQPRSHARPLRAAFVGRLVPYKGADMLIEAAAAQLSSGALTLEIIGGGPERARLEALVQSLGLADAVSFAGEIPHREVSERLQRADLFTFPSIREFGGAVVLEAMAVGVVPVVVAYGGPGELITEQTGFTVPMGNRAGIIANLSATLAGIVAAPERLAAMSEAAARRARTLFSWPAKAEQMLEVYQWALDRGPRPGFTIPLADPPPVTAAVAPAFAE